MRSAIIKAVRTQLSSGIGHGAARRAACHGVWGTMAATGTPTAAPPPTALAGLALQCRSMSSMADKSRLSPKPAIKEKTVMQARLVSAIKAKDASTAVRLYNSLAAAQSPVQERRLSQLVLLLCEQGKTQEASGILSGLHVPATTEDSEPAFAYVIEACAGRGDMALAMRHFQQARALGILLDLVTCNAVIKGLCSPVQHADCAATSASPTPAKEGATATPLAPPAASAHVLQVFACLSEQGMEPTAEAFDTVLAHAARAHDAALALHVLKLMEVVHLPLSTHACRQLHESVTRHAAHTHTRHLARCAAAARRSHPHHHHGHNTSGAKNARPLRWRGNEQNSSIGARRRAAASAAQEELHSVVCDAAMGMLARAGLLPKPAFPPHEASEAAEEDDLDSFFGADDDSGSASSEEPFEPRFVHEMSADAAAGGDGSSIPMDNSAFRDLLRELSLCAALAHDRPPAPGAATAAAGGASGGWVYELDVDALLREHAANQVEAQLHADLMYLRTAVIDPPLPCARAHAVRTERHPKGTAVSGGAAGGAPDLLSQLHRRFPNVEFAVNLSAEAPEAGGGSGGAVAAGVKEETSGRAKRRAGAAAAERAQAAPESGFGGDSHK